MFLNTGSGGIDIFEVKLTFDMLTVRGHWRYCIIPCSVLILASDWLTTVKYGAVSHV